MALNMAQMQPMQRSGVSPMARMAVGSASGTRSSPNLSRLASTFGQPATSINAGTAGGGQQSNQFQYTPLQYNQDVEKSYSDQLSQNAKDASQAQTRAQDYGTAIQRRNASNAATSGLSAGGGGFLAGQTAGMLMTQANSNDIARQYSDQAVGIRQNQANYEAGVDQTNNSMANNYAYGDWTYNRDRQDSLADQKAAAQSTADAGVIAGYGQQESSHNWGSTSAASGAWNDANNAYNEAAAKGDKAGMAAASAKMKEIAGGNNFTADGHDRTDTKLRDRIISGNPKTTRNPDGTYTVTATSGKHKGESYTTDASGNNFRYNGS